MMPDSDDPRLRIALDDDMHELSLLSVTALEARDYRMAVGVPFSVALAKAVAGAGVSFELEEFAGLAWLAVRRGDASVTFESVAGRITVAHVAGGLGG